MRQEEAPTAPRPEPPLAPVLSCAHCADFATADYSGCACAESHLHRLDSIRTLVRSRNLARRAYARSIGVCSGSRVRSPGMPGNAMTRLPPLPLRGCCEEGILTQCLDKPARINVGIACSWSTIANRPGIRRVQITRPRCANGRDNTTFATIYARRRPARRRVQAAR